VLGSGSGRGRLKQPVGLPIHLTAGSSGSATMAAMEPAFKVIPRNSTCFVIWRVEVGSPLQLQIRRLIPDDRLLKMLGMT